MVSLFPRPGAEKDGDLLRVFMKKDEANELRKAAHEIIIRLWESREITMLQMLRTHIEECLKQPCLITKK